MDTSQVGILPQSSDTAMARIRKMSEAAAAQTADLGLPPEAKGAVMAAMYGGGHPVSPAAFERQANRDIVLMYLDALNEGSLDIVDELFSPAFINHVTHFRQPSDREGFKQCLRILRDAFPDLHFDIDQVVAGGDIVHYNFTLSGTHEGELQGVPPTGRRVQVRGATTYRLANAELVERWATFDDKRLVRQLKLGKVAQAALEGCLASS